jgi:hypothetical protein
VLARTDHAALRTRSCLVSGWASAVLIDKARREGVANGVRVRDPLEAVERR